MQESKHHVQTKDRLQITDVTDSRFNHGKRFNLTRGAGRSTIQRSCPKSVKLIVPSTFFMKN
jgi:hypothetical protein